MEMEAHKELYNVDLQTNSENKPNIVFTKKIVNYFRQYCDATSIHGFRYFGENRTVYEKIWWFIVFIASLTLCTMSILSVYKKWDQSPVIVTFATKAKSISEIPFPAITVCAESKVKHTAFNYKNAVVRLRQGLPLNETEKSYIDHLAYVCDPLIDFNYSSSNYVDSKDYIDTLHEISPEFSVINCKFMNMDYPCPALFTPLVTDDGFCYSFNLLDRQEIFNENVVHHSVFHDVGRTSNNWSVETGYGDEADMFAFPFRALLSGARYGLQFDLKIANEKLDPICRGSIEGFRMLFHAPTRFPRLRSQYLRIPNNRILIATITPSQILTSEAVKVYPAEKRQCYFPHEKKLKYFRVYTITNCDTECITDYTLLECKCVLFHMPRENGTRICNAKDYKCTQDVEYQLQYTRVFMKLENRNEDSQNPRKGLCDCLPMCSDIEYKPGTSQSVWNWQEEVENELLTGIDADNITNYHLSRVKAYFVHSSFIGSERNELYGPTDFLANFGGLLGLFTGFSVLSLMEIIYFLSLRLISNIRLYGTWAGVIE